MEDPIQDDSAPKSGGDRCAVQRRHGGAGHFRGQRILPHIAGNLSATMDEATWVLTSYLVANAIILPMSGWLANYFGRKRVLLTVVTGFTASCLLCGLAPSLPMLILFRVCKASPAEGSSLSRRRCMLEEFPPRERGKAMALFGLGIVVAPILGPGSAAGSPTRIPGAGSSTSTCRSASPAWS